MSPSLQRDRRGFSLLEMILVIGLVAALVAVLSVASLTAIPSAELNATSRQLAAELEHGAQLAVLRNRPVTVRFFTSDESDPDKSKQGFQFGVADPVTGQFRATSQFFGFPESVAIHRSQKTTTLLSLADSSSSFDFQFWPDGSTSLPKDGHWCVTLVIWNQALEAELPKNYRAVVINPYNGSTTLY